MNTIDTTTILVIILMCVVIGVAIYVIINYDVEQKKNNKRIVRLDAKYKLNFSCDECEYFARSKVANDPICTICKDVYTGDFKSTYVSRYSLECLAKAIKAKDK